MPVTIYGIKNCDTMKKARAWLDGHGVASAFHDYKASGIDKTRLEGWSEQGRLGGLAEQEPARPSASCRTRTRRA